MQGIVGNLGGDAMAGPNLPSLINKPLGDGTRAGILPC